MYTQPHGPMHGRPGPGRGWSLRAILRDLRIAWRLIWDPSVPALLKICFPFLAFLYFLWPLDLMPGMPFDDIAIVLLASRLFVRLAPRDRVRKAYPEGDKQSTYYEFRNQSRNGHYSSRYNGARPDDDHDVIDTTWRVIDDK